MKIIDHMYRNFIKMKSLVTKRNIFIGTYTISVFCLIVFAKKFLFLLMMLGLCLLHDNRNKKMIFATISVLLFSVLFIIYKLTSNVEFVAFAGFNSKIPIIVDYEEEENIISNRHPFLFNNHLFIVISTTNDYNNLVKKHKEYVTSSKEEFTKLTDDKYFNIVGLNKHYLNHASFSIVGDKIEDGIVSFYGPYKSVVRNDPDFIDKENLDKAFSIFSMATDVLRQREEDDDYSDDDKFLIALTIEEKNLENMNTNIDITNIEILKPFLNQVLYKHQNIESITNILIYNNEDGIFIPINVIITPWLYINKNRNRKLQSENKPIVQ